MSTMSIKELLTKMIQGGASDLHIVVGAPPMIRIHGSLEPMPNYPRLTQEMTQELIYTVMNEEQVAEFESTRECDMSFGIEGLRMFKRVASSHGIRIISEVLAASQIEMMYDHVDVFQVGTVSRSSYQRGLT